MVLCQPFPVLIGKEHDSHLYGAKAGSLYASRTLDNPLSTNTFRGKSYETERIEQEQRAQLDFDNYTRLAAIASLAALALDDDSLLEKTNLEVKERETKQNEEAAHLTAQQERQSTTRIPPPVIERTAVVAAPAESAPNIENQRTDHDPAPVLDAHDNLTQDLLPNVDSNDTARKESLTVSADDPNDTPDDGNRDTTRINESGLERRMVDEVLPVAIIAVPIITLAPVAKRVQSSPTVITTPQAVKAKEPTLTAFSSPPAPVLQDISTPSKQGDVDQPLPQVDIKTEIAVASTATHSIDKPIPILSADVGALADSDVNSAELSAPAAQEVSLPEEPHRPLASPVEKVDPERVDTRTNASAEERPEVESAGSLEIVHFLASSSRTTNDEAKSLVTSSTIGKVANETQNIINSEPEFLSKTQTPEIASLKAGLRFPSMKEGPLEIHGAINAASFSEQVNSSPSLEPTTHQSNPIEPIAETLLHLAAVNQSGPYEILKNDNALMGNVDPITTTAKAGRIKNKSISVKKRAVKKRILKKKKIPLITAKGLVETLTVDN
jgi:hypothetical protein